MRRHWEEWRGLGRKKQNPKSKTEKGRERRIKSLRKDLRFFWACIEDLRMPWPQRCFWPCDISVLCLPQIFPQIFILRSLRVSGFDFVSTPGRNPSTLA